MNQTITRNPNLDMSYVIEDEQAWQQKLKTQTDTGLLGPRPDWWWTGKPPIPGQCPGVLSNGTLSSLPLIDLSQCTRQDVLDYFDNTWTLTEVLFSALQGSEVLYRSPYHQLRHPLVFYYGHTAAVYVNKLRVAGLLQAPINEYFEQIFETGVDEMSWDDMSKNEMTWPSFEAVHDYRKTVYNTLKQIIETHAAFENQNLPITQNNPAWAVFMGFEHERIHLETSSVLFRELPVHFLRRPEQWPPYHPTADEPNRHPPQAGVHYPNNPMVAVAAGEVILGKPQDWPSYGWDNEYGERTVRVRPFRASQYLVSNGEFYEFVKAGGYREQRYWTEGGWQWRKFRNAKWPVFWVAHGPAGLHQYKLRTCFEIIDMPWSWPADVNYHEAKAYCAWRTEQEGLDIPYRIMTEGEHNRMRDKTCFEETLGIARDPVMTTSGLDMVKAKGMNLNLAYGAQSPVDALPPTSAGFHDVFGNVWQWCEDDFNPLSNFRVHYMYDDFSTPCFDGKHNMIMGGSFISTGDEASIWARFHFRPHFFQHAGFRLVCSDDGDPTCDAVKLSTASGNVYETQQFVNEYMLLHYGTTEDAMPYPFGPRDAINFPTRCAKLLVESANKLGIQTQRAIDVGCAVGGAVFELARTFEEVVGVDLSEAFIEAANTLKHEGHLDYFRKDEGELGQTLTATIVPSIDRHRTTFRQADACALPPELVGFDAVLLANLLDRLPSPKAALARMGGYLGLVRPGGLLVIMSPYTWMEQFTPVDAWLGGYERDGTALSSKDGIAAALGESFELVSEEDMPLLIREHVRKYQYIVTHVTVWKRQEA
jgi:5-histidylcysteine sulfoxide synthase/putative 4-mercaptohistidine N1-methyltranferase